MKTKAVILAMSGGVDSSVCAHLLKKKGYSVIGITFKFWSEEFCGKHGTKSCCSLEAINDARDICAKLNIPHYVIDCETLFKEEVIGYFLGSYKKGLTPNPCIICNERIKFPLLLKKADELGAQHIATGHYAKCVFDKKAKRYLIKEARDKNKDQSYFLFSVSQEALSRAVFPLGDFAKNKVRAIAKKLKLRVHDKKESQEVCFIIDNDLTGFLKEHIGKDIKPGNIVDRRGKILGTHKGAAYFTMGQRRGLNIPYGRPIYVIDKLADNDIVIGEYSDTLKDKLLAKDIIWSGDVPEIDVKIRYRSPKARATITMLSPTTCRIDFKKPQTSPTPGQAAVFYKKDIVIGGGWITKV